MKQHYRSFRFHKTSYAQIERINAIVEDYQAQGFRLTVRQLYYQLVAKGIIPNNLKSYKNTVALVNDARLAGLIDWDAIEDRTRAFSRRYSAPPPGESLHNLAAGYHLNMWDTQEQRPYVIVEKEALVGVLDLVCHELDVPLLGARGYPSATVLREFSIYDVMNCQQNSQRPVIFHLGDHDPSGIDMTRDLDKRIALFAECEVGDIELHRIALTMKQITSQKPPPNPAKSTDSRFREYKKLFGKESWELDALDPSYLAKLVKSKIQPLIDTTKWDARKEEIEAVRRRLRRVAEDFDGNAPPPPPAPRSPGLGGGIDAL